MEECQRYEFEENFVKYFSYIIIFDVGYNSQGRGKIWITFITIMICNFLPKQKMIQKKNAEKAYLLQNVLICVYGWENQQRKDGRLCKEKQDVFVLGQRKLFRAENIQDDDKMEGKTSYNGDCSLHDIRKCASQFGDGNYYRCNYYDAIKSRIFLRRFDLILCIDITQEKGRQHGYN